MTCTERITPLGSLVLYEDNLVLADGTVLRPGDTFSVKGEGEDGSRGHYTFHTFRLHEGGEETVTAFGGDKVGTAAKIGGPRRQYRNFHAQFVIHNARKEAPAR